MSKNYVYMIQADTFVKIGVSRNPDNRLKTMQTGSPHLLRLVAMLPFPTREMAFEYENHLHRRLKNYNHRGEWFRSECIDFAMERSPGPTSKRKTGTIRRQRKDTRWEETHDQVSPDEYLELKHLADTRHLH